MLTVLQTELHNCSR